VKIQTEDGSEIENPSAEDISRIIDSLNDEDNGFAILSVEEQIYMQAAESGANGFILQYRDGSWDKHFQASPDPISAADVIKAMQQYAVGDDSWRTSLTWVPHESLSEGGCLSAVLLFVTLPMLSLANVLW